MIQVGANEEMAIRMKFNEIYLDLKVYLYIGRRRGSIRGGRPREKSLGKRVIHDVIRGGSIADSGWQDTIIIIIHGYFPRKRSNSVTIPVNKEKFTMLARVNL